MRRPFTSSFAIEAFDLSKRYGAVDAVKGITFCVQPGQVTAFLGQNGAGKSSTMKMLMGFVRPSGGQARVLGESILSGETGCAARLRIAYVAESKPLYSYMTVEQIVRFTRSFYPDWDMDLERSLIRDYELPAGRTISSLSKGMRTKLALLLAFARRPELLILDEPSEGLDPVAIESLLQTLAVRSADGVAVFFSSHQIAEVERIADHVLMLHRGQLVLDATSDNLRDEYRRIEAVFEHLPAQEHLQLEGVERVRMTGRQVDILASCNATAVVERVRSLNATSVDVTPVGLRDIFLDKASGR
jgi:ABC-2 type transport system ATP-binding protein